LALETRLEECKQIPQSLIGFDRAVNPQLKAARPELLLNSMNFCEDQKVLRNLLNFSYRMKAIHLLGRKADHRKLFEPRAEIQLSSSSQQVCLNLRSTPLCHQTEQVEKKDKSQILKHWKNSWKKCMNNIDPRISF